MSLLQHEGMPPFAEFLGIELVQLEDGLVHTQLRFRPILENRKGDVHGGVIAAVLDTTLGLVARADMDREAACSTLSLTVNYINPARGDLFCSARRVGGGRSICFVEGGLTDSNGNLIATATATFKIFSPQARP